MKLSTHFALQLNIDLNEQEIKLVSAGGIGDGKIILWTRRLKDFKKLLYPYRDIDVSNALSSVGLIGVTSSKVYGVQKPEVSSVQVAGDALYIACKKV
jgi:hypothetical protein